MQQAAGREAVAQAADQLRRQPALRWAVGAVRSSFHVVDRDKRRLAADGQPCVALAQLLVAIAEDDDAMPLLVRVRLGDARRLADPLDRHLEQLDAGSIDATADRRRAGSGVQASGRCPSPAKSPESGIEADPSRARQIDLRPSMQVGEILFRARQASSG